MNAVLTNSRKFHFNGADVEVQIKADIYDTDVISYTIGLMEDLMETALDKGEAALKDYSFPEEDEVEKEKA